MQVGVIMQKAAGTIAIPELTIPIFPLPPPPVETLRDTSTSKPVVESFPSSFLPFPRMASFCVRYNFTLQVSFQFINRVSEVNK